MISITIPLGKPLPSAANLREHWRAKAARVKTQRNMVSLALPKWKAARMLLSLHDRSIRVRFVRIAPRALDSDNLAYAFKAHRDAVAELAGVDDGSPIWSWAYAQEKGEPAIRIEVEVS